MNERNVQLLATAITKLDLPPAALDNPLTVAWEMAKQLAACGVLAPSALSNEQALQPRPAEMGRLIAKAYEDGGDYPDEPLISFGCHDDDGRSTGETLYVYRYGTKGGVDDWPGEARMLRRRRPGVPSKRATIDFSWELLRSDPAGAVEMLLHTLRRRLDAMGGAPPAERVAGGQR